MQSTPGNKTLVFLSFLKRKIQISPPLRFLASFQIISCNCAFARSAGHLQVGMIKYVVNPVAGENAETTVEFFFFLVEKQPFPADGQNGRKETRMNINGTESCDADHHGPQNFATRISTRIFFFSLFTMKRDRNGSRALHRRSGDESFARDRGPLRYAI